jgi:hypothetical protein
LWCGERPGHVTYHICVRCRTEGILACEWCGLPHATGNTFCSQQCAHNASDNVGPQITPDLPESVAVHPLPQPVTETDPLAESFPTVAQSAVSKPVKHNFYKKGGSSYAEILKKNLH